MAGIFGYFGKAVDSLEVLHQQLFLHVRQLALRTLEDAHKESVGVLVEMLVQESLLIEDGLTGTLVDYLCVFVAGSGVLRGDVRRRTLGALEGHGAEGTLVENLAVFVLDVSLQHPE